MLTYAKCHDGTFSLVVFDIDLTSVLLWTTVVLAVWNFNISTWWNGQTHTRGVEKAHMCLSKSKYSMSEVRWHKKSAESTTGKSLFSTLSCNIYFTSRSNQKVLIISPSGASFSKKLILWCPSYTANMDLKCVFYCGLFCFFLVLLELMIDASFVLSHFSSNFSSYKNNSRLSACLLPAASKWERHDPCWNIQLLPRWVQHNQICSHSENGAILPQLQLMLVPRRGMKTWSEERNALPAPVSSMPVHGEQGKVVGRANFPLQLESWWESIVSLSSYCQPL